MTDQPVVDRVQPPQAEVVEPLDPRVDFLRHHESPYLRLYSYFLVRPAMATDVPSDCRIHPTDPFLKGREIFFLDADLIRLSINAQQINASAIPSEVLAFLDDRFVSQRERFNTFIEEQAMQDVDVVALRLLLEEFVHLASEKSSRPLTLQEEETRVRDRFHTQSGGLPLNGELHQNEPLRQLLRRIKGRLQLEEVELGTNQSVETWLAKANATRDEVTESMLRELFSLGYTIPCASGEKELEQTQPYVVFKGGLREVECRGISTQDPSSIQVLPPEKGKGRRIKVGNETLYPLFVDSAVVEVEGLYWKGMSATRIDRNAGPGLSVDHRLQHPSKDPQAIKKKAIFMVKQSLLRITDTILRKSDNLSNEVKVKELQKEVSNGLQYWLAELQHVFSHGVTENIRRRDLDGLQVINPGELIKLMAWEAVMDGQGVTWDMFREFIAKPLTLTEKQQVKIEDIIQQARTFEIGDQDDFVFSSSIGEVEETTAELSKKDETMEAMGEPAFVITGDEEIIGSVTSISSGKDCPEKDYHIYHHRSEESNLRDTLRRLAGKSLEKAEDHLEIHAVRSVRVKDGYGYMFLPQYAGLQKIELQDQRGESLIEGVDYKVEYDAVHGYYRIGILPEGVSKNVKSVFYRAQFDSGINQKPKPLEAVGLDIKKLSAITSQLRALGLDELAGNIDAFPKNATTQDLLRTLADHIVYSFADDKDIVNFDSVEEIDIAKFLPGTDRKTGKLTVQCRHIARLVQYFMQNASALSEEEKSNIYTPHLLTSTSASQTARLGFKVFDLGHTEVRFERRGRGGAEQWKADITPPSEFPALAVRQLITALSSQAVQSSESAQFIEARLVPVVEQATQLKRKLLAQHKKEFKGDDFEKTVREPLHVSDKILREFLFRADVRDDEQIKVTHILDYLQRKGETFFEDTEAYAQATSILTSIIKTDMKAEYLPFQTEYMSLSTRKKFADHYSRVVRAASVARELLTYIEGHKTTT